MRAVMFAIIFAAVSAAVKIQTKKKISALEGFQGIVKRGTATGKVIGKY